MSRPLPLWTDSFECCSGTSCVRCRDTGASGIRARIGWSACYQIPEDAEGGPHGDCPKGVAWDSKEGKKSAMPQYSGGDPTLGGCGCSPPAKPD